MSMKAVHRLLGYSTLDPSLRAAYEGGMTRELLERFEVEPALIEEIALLDTSSFDDFLRLLFARALRRYCRQSKPTHPWPSHGLRGELRPTRAERAA